MEDRESSELRIENFFGLFLVLIVGCALGIALSCCDLAWAAARSQRDPDAPFLTRFWHELRFVFRFEQGEKPVQVCSQNEPLSRTSFCILTSIIEIEIGFECWLVW